MEPLSKKFFRWDPNYNSSNREITERAWYESEKVLSNTKQQ